MYTTAYEMRDDLAFVFPGQGAQSVGMLRELANEFPQVRTRYEQASQILGYDLWAVVEQGPEDQLNQTSCTQPALLTASVATWDIWLACGGCRPRMAAGHSFGEYSALVCAGALEFEDAVSLVADRGRFMQESVPRGEGAMAAVLGLDAEEVASVCRSAERGQVVQCANLNAPGQIVIAGHTAAVDRASTLAKEHNAKRVIPLSVSVPAHCALMQSAADKFAARIAGIEVCPPSLSIIHNVDASAHASPSDIKELLVQQLVAPVRWSDTVEYFAREGVMTVIECGPGKVLSTLIKRITRSITCFPLSSSSTIGAALAHIGG